jgi:Bacterial Ig-like domain (group 2)
VRRWARLLPVLAAAACSSLDEGEGGVVALEVEIPETLTIEVGEQVQMVARALNADGEVVDAEIAWQATTTAVTVDATGLVTAALPGTADVQATVGSLASDGVRFTVSARADTIVIVGDSVFRVPAAADPPLPVTLTVRLDSRTPSVAPVPGAPVIFEITSPPAGAAPVVQLVGGVQGDTITTASDGTASVDLEAVSGQVPPDTAIVQVRAERLRGDPVPGSGQRFILLFE